MANAETEDEENNQGGNYRNKKKNSNGLLPPKSGKSKMYGGAVSSTSHRDTRPAARSMNSNENLQEP